MTGFINFRDNCSFLINQLVASPCCVDLVRGDWVLGCALFVLVRYFLGAVWYSH